MPLIVDLAICPSHPCFALADCDAFYASCEAVFRPALAERPTIVLGNNDGNIIARSATARSLGIPMGAPLHEVEHLVRRHNIAVCSANFALYGDLSARVHSVLGTFTPRLDVYSIDEAFLDVSAVPLAWREGHALLIRETVRRWVGVPVSIGVAPTKTLAKAAAKRAKTLPDGVYVLHGQLETAALLREMPVEDIWGIGPRRGAFLRRHLIKTAEDFAQTDYAWVKRHLTVMGARTLLELRGISCLPLEDMRGPKQQVCCSRSFGRPVTTLGELREAVAQYASWAAEKIRAQQSAATVLTVFITTNPFQKRRPQYSQSATIRLPRATDDTLEIVPAAHGALERIFRGGYAYHKVGVILGGVVPASPAQLSLFAPPDDSRRALMATLDAINGRHGHDTIRLAAAGLAQPWRMRQANRSPRYTTCWDELAQVW